MEGDHVRHQLVERDAAVQLASGGAAAALDTKQRTINVLTPRGVLSPHVTWMEPRRKDSRFRHTGSRMSRQLKLRQAAGARAQGRAC